MKLIKAKAVDNLLYEELPLKYFYGRNLNTAVKNQAAIRGRVAQIPAVDAVPVERAITALMDLRDAFVAKQPRGEWYKSDRAQGIELGIEMAIQRVREMAERRESDAD